MKNFSLSALASVAGVASLIRAFQGLVGGLKSIASESLNSYSHFESLQKGLETFYQSADLGKEKFEELRKMSNETTFGVDDLTSSFTQLANVGADLDTINDKLFMLGNMAGGSKEKFADLTSVYSKIISTGKAGAEQLQQIATRGIPIYDVLKKIGVQGTATSEDITKAFQEMTKEGGQFYNAMNNINETIEGKEDFISDYMRELSANFAEVSGLAEIYKNILDNVKEVLGTISDWLLKINENPLAKAILQGTLLTIIGSLVGLLVGSLIPALSTVVGLLGAINPTIWVKALAGAGIGAGVGIFGGLVSGINSYKNSQIELQSELDRTIAKQKEQLGLMYEGKMTDYYQSNIDIFQDELTRLRQAVQNAKDNNNGNFTLYGSNAGWKDTSDLIGGSIPKTEARIQSLENQIVNYQNKMKEITQENEDKSLLAQVLGLASSEDINAQIAKIEGQIKQLVNYRDRVKKQLVLKGNVLSNEVVGLSKEEKNDVNKAIVYLTNKLNELKESLRTTGDEVQNTTDAISNPRGDALEAFYRQMQEMNSLESDSYGIMRLFSSKDFLNMTESGYGKNSSEYVIALDNFKTNLEQSGIALSNVFFGGDSDLGSFINGMVQSGSVFGGLINMIIGALASVFKELDGFEEFVSPVRKWFQSLAPILRIIVSLTNAISGILNILFTIIGNFLEPLTILADKLDDFSRSIGWLGDETEEAAESLADVTKELTNEYYSLLDAMKAQEEWYIENKKALNAESRINGLTSVNDMILTPNGQFSTHPDDYIIATKNPNSLGGGATINFTVNNNASDVVKVNTQRGTSSDGTENIILQISRAIASDVANGSNGWDSAMEQRSVRLAGRRVNL